jgi:hypothetical protein
MNASDFVDPNRTIHIPSRDLAGSRGRLRSLRGAAALGFAATKGERS